MRLMIVEPDPHFGGGSEMILLSLAKALAERGHQIILMHEREGSMIAAYDNFVTARIQTSLPGFPRRRPAAIARCIAAIGRSSRRLAADAIVASHLGFIPVAAWATALYGSPWCFHLGLPSPRRRRLSYRMPAAGVAPSAHTMKTWRDDGWPAETLHLVPNWVDPDRFRPAPDRALLRRELGLRDDVFYVAFVGRICREKGVEMLLEAFRRAAAVNAAAGLMLVGGVERSFEAAFAALLGSFDPDLLARVVVRPQTDSPEKYLAAADLACIPSIWDEPFGLAVLEAMSSALPVLATDVGIFAEILGSDRAALLVAPHDVEGLAGKLCWWIGNRSACEEWGRRLRRRAVTCFGPEASVSRYEALLREIIGRPRRLGLPGHSAANAPVSL